MDNPVESAAGAAAVVVILPDEIDSTNCDKAAIDLTIAFGPEVRTVIADMTHTTFCDSSAVRMLLQAHNSATSLGIEFRLVVGSETVLRIFELTGLMSTFRLYPNIDAAMADGHQPKYDRG